MTLCLLLKAGIEIQWRHWIFLQISHKLLNAAIKHTKHRNNSIVWHLLYTFTIINTNFLCGRILRGLFHLNVNRTPKNISSSCGIQSPTNHMFCFAFTFRSLYGSSIVRLFPLRLHTANQASPSFTWHRTSTQYLKHFADSK